MNLTEETNLLRQSKKIHFIGIGGIGISAIARMMLLEHKKISGSDKNASLTTEELKKLGVKIYLGHNENNLKMTDLVICTTAIPKTNPELKKARKSNIPILSYPKALGLISKNKYTIAVSGCHGKTTTTAMIGKILIDAKKDPTIIVGSFLKDEKTNFVSGKSNYLICEACEYKKAFLNITPRIIVITNVDNDHLDYYKNLKNIQKAFSEFVSKLNKWGWLIYNGKDKNSLPVAQKAKCKKIDFSKIRLPKNFKLKIPGQHNISNAKAAIATTKLLKIKNIKILKNFKGTWRRFEYKGKTQNGALIYDDYAHHPTEIKATLKTVCEFFKNKKIYCVFQPHLFSRTKMLLKDFAESFDNADKIIITNIYAARETLRQAQGKQISGKNLADKIPNALYIKKFTDIEKFLKQNTGKNDIILTMGAGDVFKISKNLVK